MRKILISLLLAVLLAAPQGLRGTAVAAGPERQARGDAASAKDAFQNPMTVVMVKANWTKCQPNCPMWIAAEGDITPATPALFRKVLRKAGRLKLPVLIDSPGGSVTAAIEIGRLLRKAGLPVVVATTAFDGCAPQDKTCQPGQWNIYTGTAMTARGYCASACPLILAGGIERYAHPDTQVGVHQIRTIWTREQQRVLETYRIVNGRKKVISTKVVGRKVSTYDTYGIDKDMRKRLRAYLSEMGVSGDLVAEIDKAPYSSINILSHQRMAELKLVSTDDSASPLVDSARCAGLDVEANCPNAGWLASQSTAHPETASPPEASMRILRVRATGTCEPFCPEWIVAEGRIARDSPARLRAALAAMGLRKLPVVLDSGGGDLDAALEMGRMVREAGLLTIIAATQVLNCGSKASCDPAKSLSAPASGHMQRFGRCERECLLLLAGGVKRYAAYVSDATFAPPASLKTRTKQNKAAAVVADYLREMKLAPALLTAAATGTTGSPFRVRRDDMLIYGLGTSTADPAFITDPLSCKRANPPENCVRRTPPPPPGEEMLVVRMRAKGKCGNLCPEWIWAQGLITAETPKLFRQLLDASPGAKLPVILDSRGGNLDAALEIGRMIRDRGLITVVGNIEPLGCRPRNRLCNASRPAAQPYAGFAYSGGTCSGACLFVLAAGTARAAYWAGTVSLSLSELFATPNARVGAPDYVTAYLRDMGISPALLARAQDSSAPLDREETLQFALSTGRESADDFTAPTLCMGAVPVAHCITLAAGRSAAKAAGDRSSKPPSKASGKRKAKPRKGQAVIMGGM